MRSEGQIRYQLKQVTYRHLQRRLRDNFRQRPDTCAHNKALVLDESTGTSLGMCGLLSEDGCPRDIPCDARLPGGSERARECPLWEPLQTKEQIKADFKELLQNPDRGVIAAQYPDIAALLWVLDDAGEAHAALEVEDSEGHEHDVPPHRWWGGLRKWLGGGGE